jgi:hypothetical protein
VAWVGWRRGLEQADQVGTLFGVAGRRKTHRRMSSTAVCGVRGGVLVRWGLSAVAGTFGEVVEVHGVVEELLSARVGSERVQRKLVTKELLVAVEEDRDGG